MSEQIDKGYFANVSKFRKIKKTLKRQRNRKIRRTTGKPLTNRYDGWLY